MLKANRKRLSTFLIALSVFVIIAILSFTYLNLLIDNMDGFNTNLTIGNGNFTTGLALDQDARVQGLSTFGDLRPNQALLMAFPSDGNWGIWMKQMNFPIDIVWLNSSKEIIYLVPYAMPGSYPTVYAPPEPARFVIELPAGTISKKSIIIGKKAIFQLNMGDIK